MLWLYHHGGWVVQLGRAYVLIDVLLLLPTVQHVVCYLVITHWGTKVCIHISHSVFVLKSRDLVMDSCL